ncbi:flagellar biosynthesis protein FlgE [Duganella sp. Leaf126]|uniref:flagellar hook protein FlgE n=1 Tax=Duganella sp. Leaf126 TaxID=1736266 RepID=UPI0006F636D5|nr:flagellar hook-basal body complex protein [Duganella sp. Leaf126]KQQ36130.1 flagellar biosynthesis protein FlgE [Duganella sp. Leaf126]
MSFDIALSGIQAINESLNSTSQNIANAGTYGYKAQRANFSSLVAGSSQTGVMIGSTTQNISKPGSVLNTGRTLDAAINGSGFFITRDASSGQTEYTRVGIFDASKDGFLIDAQGRRVQGYPVNTATGTQGALGDVPIPTGAIPSVASTKMNYVGNMSADWAVPQGTFNTPPITPAAPPDPSTFNMSKATVAYDTLGGKHTLTQYFVRDTSNPNLVNVNYVLDGALVSGQTTQLAFNTSTGALASVNGVAADTVSDIALNVTTSSGGKLGSVSIDYAGTTGYAGEATTSTNSANGYASGTFTSVSLGSDGSLIATYTNGQKQTVGRVALATFANEGALTTVSGTSWVESVDSGSALVNAPGVGIGGTINSSSLEQSNVDITSELVGLMTSQRNYQANSKVIQTESTMLQSLMQAI